MKTIDELQAENFLLRNALDRLMFLLLSEGVEPALLARVHDIIEECNHVN